MSDRIHTGGYDLRFDGTLAQERRVRHSVLPGSRVHERMGSGPPVPAETHDRTDVVQGTPSFEDFFQQTHQRLFGGLCLVTQDRHEAEELMQDAYLKIWERWERVAEMDEPTGFLFRTAMNLFRSRRRRAAVALRRTAAPALDADGLALVEDRDEVVRALRELTPAQRAAVVMTSMFGYTAEEAASVLGIKAATVRAHASRGRADLRANAGDEP
jgi:RNA polymerase sigma-70 factor (ECF subfamily)